MPFATALVSTDRADRYAKQLVSHLGHQADSRPEADGRGEIVFDRGTCVIIPTGYGLELIATAPDLDGLAVVEDVVTRHLLRFATTDELSVDWSEPVAGDEFDPVHLVVADYALTHSTAPDELLRELVAETRDATGRRAGMHTVPP
jgi:caffeoyl-CoA O-methyltransferase